MTRSQTLLEPAGAVLPVFGAAGVTAGTVAVGAVVGVAVGAVVGWAVGVGTAPFTVFTVPGTMLKVAIV